MHNKYDEQGGLHLRQVLFVSVESVTVLELLDFLCKPFLSGLRILSDDGNCSRIAGPVLDQAEGEHGHRCLRASPELFQGLPRLSAVLDDVDVSLLEEVSPWVVAVSDTKYEAEYHCDGQLCSCRLNLF